MWKTFYGKTSPLSLVLQNDKKSVFWSKIDIALFRGRTFQACWLNLHSLKLQSNPSVERAADLAHGGRRRAVRHHHVGAPDGGQAGGGQVAAGHRRAWEQETITKLEPSPG